MSQIYFIPAEGLLIPDPAVRGSSAEVRVPPEGKWVEDGPYWRRRERDGDGRIEWDRKPNKSEPKEDEL